MSEWRGSWTRAVKATALVDRNIDKDRALLHALQHRPRDELRRAGAGDQRRPYGGVGSERLVLDGRRGGETDLGSALEQFVELAQARQGAIQDRDVGAKADRHARHLGPPTPPPKIATRAGGTAGEAAGWRHPARSQSHGRPPCSRTREGAWSARDPSRDGVRRIEFDLSAAATIRCVAALSALQSFLTPRRSRPQPQRWRLQPTDRFDPRR